MASLPRSARLLRALIAAVCPLLLVQACGRSEPGDYLYGSDDPITAGASSARGGARSMNGGTPSVAGFGVGGSGVGGASVSVGGALVGVAGAPKPSGGSEVGGGTSTGGFGVAGAGPIAGTGGGAPVSTITCGAQLCNADTQRCCAGLSGLACIGNDQTCVGAVLGCTVNDDCGGDGVCCISITGELDAASSCKPRCELGTSRDRQLCQSDDECALPFRFCTPTIFGVNICTRRG